MINFRAFVLLAGSLLAVATTATAEPLLSMPGAPFQGPAPVVQKQLRLAMDAPSRMLTLGAVTATERAAAAKAATVTDKRMPLQIGFARTVPADMAQIDLSSLAWQDMGDGSRAARIVLESPDAAAIRAELVLTGGADGLSFRFGSNAPGAQVFGPYTWAELEAAARWTPVLEGSAAIIDIEAVPGASRRRENAHSAPDLPSDSLGCGPGSGPAQANSGISGVREAAISTSPAFRTLHPTCFPPPRPWRRSPSPIRAVPTCARVR